MFVDQADIHVFAGDGGNGCVSFRREKFVPRGGPDGGNGGRGGSVHIRASAHHNTLVNYKYHPEFRAARGAHGEGSNRTGQTAADLVLEVPVGTIVYKHGQTGLTQLADLSSEGDTILVARGGRGGRGNASYATATNQAPRQVEPGYPGEACHLRLSLKLLADVGLVGFPNVGKSTLIARLSAARPKIADYPFTTLTPHLGVVRLDENRSFVLADVPGLIEGAHEGHGLGHRFLSHLERTKVLVHVIDVSSASGRDPVDDFDVICRELGSYRGDADGAATSATGDLATKPQLVAANKIDALDDPDRLKRLRDMLEARGLQIHPVSAVTGEGLKTLRESMWRAVAAAETDAPHTTQVSTE